MIFSRIVNRSRLFGFTLNIHMFFREEIDSRTYIPYVNSSLFSFVTRILFISIIPHNCLREQTVFLNILLILTPLTYFCTIAYLVSSRSAKTTNTSADTDEKFVRCCLNKSKKKKNRNAKHNDTKNSCDLVKTLIKLAY